MPSNGTSALQMQNILLCMKFFVVLSIVSFLVAVIQPQGTIMPVEPMGFSAGAWRNLSVKARVLQKRSSEDSLKSPELFMRQTCKRMWGRNFPGFARRPGFFQRPAENLRKSATGEKRKAPKRCVANAASFKKSSEVHPRRELVVVRGTTLSQTTPPPAPLPLNLFF